MPSDLSDTFTGWVHDILEFADDPERRQSGMVGLITYFLEEVGRRRDHPGDDLLSELLQTEVDGAPIEEAVVLGLAALVLIAGVDTTWSAIGSSLWHLATQCRRPQEAGDRARTDADRDRGAAAGVHAGDDGAHRHGRRRGGRLPDEGRRPRAHELPRRRTATRRPSIDADEVVLDRATNRHVAFGSGIHRCAGSNLARMELRVALEEWLARIPEFRLADPAAVTWAGGQVRGPRNLPVVFP